MTKNNELANQKIAISQLKPGMYVVAITNETTAITVKSEGYVLSKETIAKMKKSGVSQVVVNPNKEKKTNKIDRILPDIKSTPLSSKKEAKTEVSLESEMRKASSLYNDAKSVQEKILQHITKGKEIDVGEVQKNTDAIVSSIFRNQDALCCMSRLRFKDQYLVEHSLNVSILISIFAKHLNIEKNIIEQLSLGAFLHDIGKILIPSEILNKPGKLTEQEYEIMKNHVNLGIKALQDTPNIPDIAQSIILQHHERIAGHGYPNQLSNEQISQYGRMIAIVDSYDAMTADRVYKVGMHPIKAFKILIKESPESYDTELVEQFVQCLGIYPVGTLVKLNSGKLGLISKLNKSKPLNPFIRVFYNTRLNQNIAMEEIDLSQSKYQDQIDCCIKPEEFSINLVKFFKAAFIN
jgi:putative nucleotidyltransferase with HDIG domain